MFVVFSLIGYSLKQAIESIPNVTSPEQVQDMSFDFIICGSGTAGSVLSHHLSKLSNFTVLLIEAGSVFDFRSKIPLASVLMQGGHYDWRYQSTPQKYSSKAFHDQKQSLPRGRGLGGTDQINFLLHYNGNQSKDEFDQWEELGARDWNYESLKYFLNKHESPESDSKDDNEMPKLSLTSADVESSKLIDAFQEAEKEIGSPPELSFNVAEFTTRSGTRHSVFHEYLMKAFSFKKLKILINAEVERIEFVKKVANSVVVRINSNEVIRIYAKHEIILSAGTYNTPKILKMSGIGDEKELKRLNIQTIHHLPTVGKNLFDHISLPLFVSIEEKASITIRKLLSIKEVLKYLILGKGYFSNTGIIGTVNDRKGFGSITFGMGSIDEKTLKSVANYKMESFRAFYPFYADFNQEGFVALNTCWLPKSRGEVELNPENFELKINPNYLKVKADVDCIRNALNVTMTLINTKAFKKLNAKIHWPKVKDCRNFGPFRNTVTKRYLDCIIRFGALTLHHPLGTSAIGQVVDSDLRVLGVKNLRIVDGSVFPAPISGFPNSIIIALAERASHLILNENKE